MKRRSFLTALAALPIVGKLIAPRDVPPAPRSWLHLLEAAGFECKGSVYVALHTSEPFPDAGLTEASFADYARQPFLVTED